VWRTATGSGARRKTADSRPWVWYYAYMSRDWKIQLFLRHVMTSNLYNCYLLVMIIDFSSCMSMRGLMLIVTPATLISNSRHNDFYVQQRWSHLITFCKDSRVLILLYLAAEALEHYLTCCRFSMLTYYPPQLAFLRTLSTIRQATLCFPCCQKCPERTRRIKMGYSGCGGTVT